MGVWKGCEEHGGGLDCVGAGDVVGGDVRPWKNGLGLVLSWQVVTGSWK